MVVLVSIIGVIESVIIVITNDRCLKSFITISPPICIANIIAFCGGVNKGQNSQVCLTILSLVHLVIYLLINV